MAWKPVLTVVSTLALAASAATAFGATPTVDPTVPAARDAEPVILTGQNIPEWSARANVTAKLPATDLLECSGTVDPSRGGSPNDWLVADSDCQHNGYTKPEFDSGTVGKGVPVNTLLGFRYNPKANTWEQIPFQVDEVFTRYLNNSASGFALYSGEDQHTTYQFDREGFRLRKEDPQDPCHALADSPTAVDPVAGLDDNDEMAFMASDAGARAPRDKALPYGTWAAREVEVRDPSNPQAPPRYAYVMRAWDKGGAKPAFDASTGYVHYDRADDADTFYYSQSGYDSYGNAPKGHFMWDGKCVGATPDEVKDNPKLCTQPNGDPLEKAGQTNQLGDNNAFIKCPQRHRPGDAAKIQTDRYRFTYEGRWLLTGLEISGDGGNSFGPDLIDRWKARAFAQDPYSQTPCCGYEDEDKNWGGSSNLIGERSGPVRTIRETWGADSGTNVIRRETFYRKGMRQKTFLRVHVIPPLDGIYAQWDFNAGKVDRYYNPRVQDGVPVDGRNDEAVGNLDDPCNGIWDGNERTDFDTGYRDAYKDLGLCGEPFNRYHQSVDLTDPTFATPNASLDWNEVTGPHGTVVDRYQLEKVTDVTAGGTPQSVFAMPYYRDDSCFDDGTGTDPGPRVLPRSENEPRTYTAPDGSTQPRQCWKPADGDPAGSGDKYFQGDVGTHGLHLLLVAESDNARQTVPVTEIDSEQRLAFLPGRHGPEVGEQYGRGFEKPLVATVTIGYDPTDQYGPPAQDPPPATDNGGSNDNGGSTGTDNGAPNEPVAGSNGGTAGVGAFAPGAAANRQAVKGDRAAAHAAIPCLPRKPRLTSRGIGRLRIGDTKARAIARMGTPSGAGKASYSWCVNGGGRVTGLFDTKGRVQLIALRRSNRGKLAYRADRRLRKAQVKRLLRSL